MWMNEFKKHFQQIVPIALETRKEWTAAISWKYQKKKMTKNNFY